MTPEVLQAVGILMGVVAVALLAIDASHDRL